MGSRPSHSASLERGRSCFALNAWRDAYAGLSEADKASPLGPDDIETLATAAYLIGNDAESADLFARAHHEFLRGGSVERAVRCACSLALGLFFRGEYARSGGWVARAQRLLEDSKRDCVERGYVVYSVALQNAMAGDGPSAYRLFSEAAEFATRYGDRTLGALARNGQGRALIKMGEPAKGIALMDETMASIEAGDVMPLIAGIVYCSMIEACTEVFDLRRAQEWTSSLTRWCEAQPDLVPFRGVCQIRRAELMQLHGDWEGALTESRHARERLSDPPPPQPSVGAAMYQEAELYRLRGEFTRAEAAYRESNKWSRKSRPGMAQLRLALGQVDAALSAIRFLLDEAKGRDARPALLAACVEIALAANDVNTARAAADELTRIAADIDAPLLKAMATYAEGSVLLAEGNAAGALALFRRSCATWQELGAPYEAARVRVLIGAAARAFGDHDTAAMELDAARSVFRQIGAIPDLERIDALSQPEKTGTAGGLTPRELEVLRLVAEGKTNRTIAKELFISEKTVHRHVSNIFLKLELSSRAAATAYAFQHGLV